MFRVSAECSAAAVQLAATNIGTVLRCTPLEASERLSAELGVLVLLKREDIQVCRSYKTRGAYNLISSLTAAQRDRGVVCASAAARLLGPKLVGPVVCIVTGGNNDVSRYSEVVERSLLYEGLRHYFLVNFPQEPGALRRFLDEILTNGEDIVAFEYIKKSNREAGPALVGIDLEAAHDIDALLARMDTSRFQIERIPPGSPLFTFLI